MIYNWIFNGGNRDFTVFYMTLSKENQMNILYWYNINSRFIYYYYMSEILSTMFTNKIYTSIPTTEDGLEALHSILCR